MNALENSFDNQRVFRYVTWSEAEKLCKKAGLEFKNWNPTYLQFVEITNGDAQNESR